MATLGFSTKWPRQMGGGNTLFVPKIWKGLEYNSLAAIDLFSRTLTGVHTDRLAFEKDSDFFDVVLNSDLEGISWLDVIPKLHTIRYDPKNLWVPGRKIHMVVFNRSKNRFQFAPVLECKSVQEIDITRNIGSYSIYIDERELPYMVHFGKSGYSKNTFIQKLAANDGFDSVERFFQWFNTNTLPGTKIIHWTDLRY